MKESYFMGIDTGTNSSKGVLINSHGEIIAEHTTEHAMTNPAPGHYEHDADKLVGRFMYYKQCTD